MRNFFRNRLLAAGVILFVVICLLSIFQPVIVRALIGNINPMAQGNFPIFDPPRPQHILGTDRYGRDVVSLLLIGLRFSLSIGIMAGVIGTLLGTIVGLV